MIRRIALTAVLLALASLAAFSLLALLAHFQVDPIRRIFSSEPEFRQHGKPVFSVAGAVLWMQVVAAYAIGSSLLAGRCWRLERSVAVALGLALGAAATVYISICHPLLLPTLLSTSQWESYSSVAERVAPLRDIYYHFGFPRLKYQLLAGQILLAIATFLLVAAVSHIRGRSKPRRGPS